jgi:hypothetical protein
MRLMVAVLVVHAMHTFFGVHAEGLEQTIVAWYQAKVH